MAKALSAPDRLQLLLPWLNRSLDEYVFEAGRSEPVAVRTDFAAVRDAIAAFLKSFDGSAAAAHLEVIDDPTPAHIKRLGVQHRNPDDEQLEEMGAVLRILLAQGLGDGLLGDVSDLSIGTANLRISVRHAGRRKPENRRVRDGGSGKGVMGGVTAQRDYKAAGAYVRRVHGPIVELVPFVVTELLTAPDMVAVKRCERAGCEHFVVAGTAVRGAPRKFCSTCRPPTAQQLERQQRREGREQQRKQRRK